MPYNNMTRPTHLPRRRIFSSSCPISGKKLDPAFLINLWSILHPNNATRGLRLPAWIKLPDSRNPIPRRSLKVNLCDTTYSRSTAVSRICWSCCKRCDRWLEQHFAFCWRLHLAMWFPRGFGENESQGGCKLQCPVDSRSHLPSVSPVYKAWSQQRS